MASALTARKNKTLCPYPFVGLSTVPAGFLRPCCYFSRMLNDRDGRMLSVMNDRLDSIWNGSDMREIRRKMLRGEEVPNCDQCYKEEALGSTSLRHRGLDEFEGDPILRQALLSGLADAATQDGAVSTPPTFLEIKPGNLCNLKCRMCNQFDSSALAAEMKILAEKYPDVIAKSDSRLLDSNTFSLDFEQSKMPDWSHAPQFWADVEKYLPALECLSFAGGEPTLIEQVKRLLEICVETGHAEHIRIFLSSNFTRLDDWIFAVAPHFKMFTLIASIDGKDSVQEYIRHPSRWESVSENYRRALGLVDGRRVRVIVNLTLQLYNALSFTDLLSWLDGQLAAAGLIERIGPEFHPYVLNLLYNPRHLSLDILPPELRPQAIERIENFMDSSPVLSRCAGLNERLASILHQLRADLPATYASDLRKFSSFTALLDHHRERENLGNVEPRLAAAVHSELRRFDTRHEVHP